MALPRLNRNIVLLLILYVGWLGVLAIVVPVVTYKKTRSMGASYLQAIFLAAASFFLGSLFMSIGKSNRPAEFSQVHFDRQLSCERFGYVKSPPRLQRTFVSTPKTSHRA